jgi:FKBP-type peptidyl-prolyl cis-trans isomerase 2
MQNGDFIEIEYTGRVKDTGEVFDITSAEEAKKLGVYNEKAKYGTAFVIIGNGMVVPGVEKQLLGMKTGDEKTFDIGPADGFGERNPDFIKIVSLSSFLEKKISPYPGLFVDINGIACKVQSVSGGRVRVDFNHPLAGKNLEYTVKILREITDKKYGIEKLLGSYRLEADAGVAEKVAKIKINGKKSETVEKFVSETVKKWVKGIETVEVEFAEKKNRAEGAGNSPA